MHIMINFDVWVFIELLDKFMVFYMHMMIVVGIGVLCSYVLNKMESEEKK